MRLESISLAVQTGSGTGASQPIADFTDHAILLTGMGTGTVYAEGTPDGTTWGKISADATANGFLVISSHLLRAPLRAIRLVSASVTGTPVAVYSGHNARTL